MKRGFAALGLILLFSVGAIAQSMKKGDFSANITSESWMLNGGTGAHTHW